MIILFGIIMMLIAVIVSIFDLFGFLPARVDRFCPAHSVVHDVDQVVLYGGLFNKDETYIMPCHSPQKLYDETSLMVKKAAISSRWEARRLLRKVDAMTRREYPRYG
jgi:hypothetical protein